MPEQTLKIALVGAASLLGKALNDELAISSFSTADFHLLEEEDGAGKLTSAADEARIIQPVEADSFEKCDFTFFAGSPELTLKHWQQALKAGSRVVDLSGALADQPGILVRAPWVQEESLTFSQSAPQSTGPLATPDLQTRAVISAHPVAVLLAMFAIRSQHAAPVRRVWATLLQPASEYGQAALEELHQQTTNLLSFQSLPTQVFGSQSAFNLAVSFGSESRVNLFQASELIRRQYAIIAPSVAAALALQIVQVPVFHGYAVSLGLEFDQPVSLASVTEALAGSHVRLVTEPGEFPGNVQAVEETDVQVLVQPIETNVSPAQTAGIAFAGKPDTTRFWLWIIADNLKFAAQNAIACAVELNRLRPRGIVQ
ncbi:MAG TPA: Asd/ArgC dimerization domain-containing protein [Acidobacteriaceae bacterium]|nr:Asd/ArgC dimerization domain-containing protein [Acidobacteriaceae bacterium]